MSDWLASCMLMLAYGLCIWRRPTKTLHRLQGPVLSFETLGFFVLCALFVVFVPHIHIFDLNFYVLLVSSVSRHHSAMGPFAFFMSASVLFAQSTVAFNCSKKPIYVDIHKRAVQDSPAFQYGSFIGLGTPAQNHSLWPSLAQNHTSFASHEYCDNSTLKDCETSTGGYFSPQDSTS